MKGQTNWQYKPYTRLIHNKKKLNPYIVHIAPYEKYCEVQWIDNGYTGEHKITCHHRGGTDVESITTPDCFAKIDGLKAGREYEVIVERVDGSGKSDYRFFKTGYIIGTVVNYLHPLDDAYSFSGRFLCSPCILRTKTGRLLASMDVYGRGTAQNLTLLVKSDDDGKTWQWCCDILPSFWGKLFNHEGDVYMLSMTAEYGEFQVGVSKDDGETWSKPVTLFPGAGVREEQGMHQAPTPVVIHEGRLYTGVDYGSWFNKEGYGHASAIASCDVTKDILDPANWVLSEFTPYDKNWEGAVPHSMWGGHEGNAVLGPDGEIYNILRNQITSVRKKHIDDSVITNGKAFILKLDKNDLEKPLEFVRFIDFNGGSCKFVIRRDEKTGNYVALVNKVVDNACPGQRNILSLSVSKDMFNWTIVKDLIDASDYSPHEVGFQYPDFIIDGDDILYLSRTAFNGADNFHNSNYITFHKLEDFRQYL